MSCPIKPQVYRDVIDALVNVCKHGQGQIGPNRARQGLWNANATVDFIPDQHRFNLLLSRLSQNDREILADMLAQEVQRGVFETLRVLGEFRVEPFTEGYEGEAYHDFAGRLNDWTWPEE